MKIHAKSGLKELYFWPLVKQKLATDRVWAVCNCVAGTFSIVVNGRDMHIYSWYWMLHRRFPEVKPVVTDKLHREDLQD